ncbi:phosphatidylinositol-specific phospholipase C1-like protein [Lunatibacter salilacus]|uniref:phosphatidylinositol-specific phospholipase C1-like protein n=1 Tax=Lunatibacter salilacus TaxID=2483804 RepID=UPI00131E401F|nr:phosphatidylinositol-specific phospholipase C1-like protein [Lunatibacter salilacus]
MKLLQTILLLIMPVAFFSNSALKSLAEIKLNDIQIIGSHNSYKIGIERPLFEYLLKSRPALSGLEYEHIPLSDQLNLGLRGLELDVFYDPKGGYYSDPKGLEIVKSMGEEPEPFDVEQKLRLPGLKVFHVQEIDFRSHQLLFKDALRELKKWSQSNEGHTPIIITINAKDGKIPLLRDPLPFTAEALKSIDSEILEIFDGEDLITPDLVRGDFETLEQAVLAKGWPLLEELKNRFLFVLDEGNEKTDGYLSNFENFNGATLFVNKEEGNPEAAFRIINDPVNNFDKIKNLVSLGYMVRTRADADTKEARENDYSRFEKAKESGAQVITTDYYQPSRLFESDFKVIFDNGSYERNK